MKKPALPAAYTEPNAWANLRTIIDTLIGRRGNRLQAITPMLLTAASTPTKAEYDTLAARVLQLEQAYEALRDRLDS